MDLNSLKTYKKSNTPNIINLPNKNQDIALKNKGRVNHLHGLVICITNLGWNCVNCKKDFHKNEPKYYCSLCDLSICSNCKNKNNKDNLISNFCLSKPDKEFGQKFLFNNNHQHKLAFLSRDKNWKCSLCGNPYNRENWSLSCTACNYDICLKCSK